MTNSTRIYENKVDINQKDVRNFWSSRAETNDLNSVLLGNQKIDNPNILRNEKEFNLLKVLTKSDFKKYKVIDIGCGIGRWASNLKDKVSIYHGIDYCDEFIQRNKEHFKDYKNISFYRLSAEKINEYEFKEKYDLAIINGMLMYINDNSLEGIFKALGNIEFNALYLQETISTLNYRMTLDNFYSNELKTNYSAIYRTKTEYESYLKSVLYDYKILNSGFLLDDKIGARKETNAFYWFLKKGI